MKKIIAWESWNVKEKELAEISDLESFDMEMQEESEQIMQSDNFLSPILGEIRPQVIQTPWGVVSFDSALKPSDIINP